MKKINFLTSFIFLLAFFLPTKVGAECSIPSGAPICEIKWNGYKQFKTLIQCSERVTIDALGCLLEGLVEILLLAAWVIAVIWIIVSGIQYGLALGDPEKIAGAKKSLIWAVIGLIISISAYAILKFIDTVLIK